MPETDTIPVSASTASTGLGIRYVGNWAYAYNTQTMINSSTPVFAFTTGAGLIVGEFELSGPLSFTSGGIASGDVTGLQINLNGVTVAYLKSDTQTEDMPATTSWNIIIPPITKVEVNILAPSTSGDYTMSVAFVGRVYGAE